MALGGFFGAFANMISGLATSSMQRADNEYLMNRQAELNKEQADYSTDLAKNYWDYTNFENSVKHLKEAGLNPAYDEIMADNTIPWDTKAKFSALVMGTVPSACPMMDHRA